MTCARREIYDPTKAIFFHCISRCVRRAYLCGVDSYSSKSYEHRKEWVRELLRELGEIFSVDLLAYAVMSNHLHTVLRGRHDLSLLWSAEEVAKRWRKLFPLRFIGEEPNEEEITAITREPELVAEYRQRLSNLSWFHRCLNERLARRANAEDECTGRFWEGRFKSIRLEDDAAVLACCAYVDLNPIRAGMSKTLEASDFTSVQDRIRRLRGEKSESRPKLLAISELLKSEVTERSYVRLVAETGNALIGGKRIIGEVHHACLRRLGIRPEAWMLHTKSHSRLFHRIAGPLDALRLAAKKCRKSYFQGIGSARLVFT